MEDTSNTRFFNSLRKTQLMIAAGTKIMTKRLRYTRTYNIGCKEFVPCIVSSTSRHIEYKTTGTESKFSQLTPL